MTDRPVIAVFRWSAFLLFLLLYGFVFVRAYLATSSAHGLPPPPEWQRWTGTVITFLMAPLCYLYGLFDYLLFPLIHVRLPDTGYFVCLLACATAAGYFLVLRPVARYL